MTEDILAKELKQGAIRKIYYLYGKEPFLVKTYADRIIDKCLGGERGFNYARFEGNPDVSRISECVQTLPVFADRKVVLLNDLDFEKSDTDALASVLSAIPESTTVIISVTGFVPDLKKAKTKKLAELADKHGASVEFGKLSEAKTADLITKRAVRAGCGISRANAVHLATLCLCDLNLIANETDKLCAYANYGGEITREAVDLLTAKQLDTGVFALAAEITAKKSGEALRVLDELITLGNPPVMIMSALSAAFIDFYRAKIGAEAGKRADVIAADFNYPKNRAWAVGKAISAVARTPAERICKCVLALANADYKLKSAPLDDRYIMERAVAELITLC